MIENIMEENDGVEREKKTKCLVEKGLAVSKLPLNIRPGFNALYHLGDPYE